MVRISHESDQLPVFNWFSQIMWYSTAPRASSCRQLTCITPVTRGTRPLWWRTEAVQGSPTTASSPSHNYGSRPFPATFDKDNWCAQQHSVVGMCGGAWPPLSLSSWCFTGTGSWTLSSRTLCRISHPGVHCYWTAPSSMVTILFVSETVTDCPAPTPLPTEDDDHTGTIVGVVIVVFFIIMVLVGIVIYMRRGKGSYEQVY